MTESQVPLQLNERGSSSIKPSFTFNANAASFQPATAVQKKKKKSKKSAPKESYSQQPTPSVYTRNNDVHSHEHNDHKLKGRTNVSTEVSSREREHSHSSAGRKAQKKSRNPPPKRKPEKTIKAKLTPPCDAPLPSDPLSTHETPSSLDKPLPPTPLYCVEEFPSLSSLPAAHSSDHTEDKQAAKNFLAVVHESIRTASEAEAEAETSRALLFAEEERRKGWFTSTGRIHKQQLQQQNASNTMQECDSMLPLASLQDDNEHQCHSKSTHQDSHSISSCGSLASPPTRTNSKHTTGRYLFQQTITDTIREKYRTRWLDLAREVTLRDQHAAVLAKEHVDVERAGRSGGGGGGGVKGGNWHSALSSAAVQVSNSLLDARYRHTGMEDERGLERGPLMASVAEDLTLSHVNNTSTSSCTSRSMLHDAERTGKSERDGDGDGDSDRDARCCAWWRSVCSGDVVGVQDMLQQGFAWSALTFGKVNCKIMRFSLSDVMFYYWW